MTTRINKYLSESGYCSRRAADRLIEEGKVTINGEIPELGTKVNEDDQVKVEGQIIEKSTKQKKIYLAFHKPVGIVCTTDRRVELSQSCYLDSSLLDTRSEASTGNS